MKVCVHVKVIIILLFSVSAGENQSSFVTFGISLETYMQELLGISKVRQSQTHICHVFGISPTVRK